MGAEVEAVLLELRRTRPYWNPRRLVFELGRRGVRPAPSSSGVYRALPRAGMIDPAARDRRSRKWKRWERDLLRRQGTRLAMRVGMVVAASAARLPVSRSGMIPDISELRLVNSVVRSLPML